MHRVGNRMSKPTGGAFGKASQPDTNVCGFWNTKRGRRMLRMMRRVSKGALVPESENRSLVGPLTTRETPDFRGESLPMG